jgi:hypothetical protein
MARERIVEIYGPNAIFFHNSMGAETGPWTLEHGVARHIAGEYDVLDISERLQNRITAALTSGNLPVDIPYDADDLARPWED